MALRKREHPLLYQPSSRDWEQARTPHVPNDRADRQRTYTMNGQERTRNLSRIFHQRLRRTMFFENPRHTRQYKTNH
jgi:hypothetical protein